MTKAELIRAISAETGLGVKDAAAALEAILSVTAEELAQGGKVQLTGFGTFLAKDREAHVGRNLATGAAVEVPARRAVLFRPGKLLRERVNGGEAEGNQV